MINKEATIRWKGYDPDELSHGSSKRVWANCDECGDGRWVSFNSYRDLCFTCAMKSDEVRKKIGDASRRRKHSNETKLQMRISRKKYTDSLPDKKVDKICKWCGKSYRVLLSSNSEFCSRLCVNEWQSKYRKGVHYKEQIEKECIYCGIIYTVMPYLEFTSKFCSKDCHNKWKSENQIGENSPGWKGGITNAPYCEKFNDIFREKIRNLFNRLCFLCSKNEEENGRKLDVHHVNADKDCLCGIKCEFVPLCRKCHGKTIHKAKQRYWEDLIMCHLYPDRITMVDL